MSVRKTAEIFLELQPYIDQPPVPVASLHAQACSNDGVTVNAWRDTWVSQYQANHAVHGPFKDKSIAKLYQKHRHSPVFLLGSGPSLKKNAHLLKDKKGIPIISCLHNFHFLEDLGIDVDYYVTLDAGPITIEEVSEGGNPETDYWAKTKGKTLLAYAGSHPNLLAKWQGEILFFNCSIPERETEEKIKAVEYFPHFVSSGGNVLGASLYIAKTYLGCETSIFLGADFSFGYNEKFHGWDSKYDIGLGHVVRMIDIYGVPVKTWPSYMNFASFFNWVAQSVPGRYINCTEGGIFGAFRDGNIRAVEQLPLEHCLERFSVSDHLKPLVDDPTGRGIIVY